MEYPTKSLLDPTFRYVPSHSTDLRRTFERIRHDRELAKRLPAAATPIKSNPDLAQ